MSGVIRFIWPLHLTRNSHHTTAPIVEGSLHKTNITGNHNNSLKKEEASVTLSVGSKVMYPSQGPCLVGALVEKDVAGVPVSFYRLVLLNESRSELFVPIEKVANIGLRPLLQRSEIPALLAQMMQASPSATDWKQRTQINLKRLASGSAFDLALVVESLTLLNGRKPLSTREQALLEKAKRLLVCEIAEVLEQSTMAAEEQINSALKP